MKHLFRVATLTVAIAALAGCASTRTELSGVPGSSAKEVPDAGQARRSGARETYVERVESLARERGLQVYWVNPPVATLVAVE